MKKILSALIATLALGCVGTATAAANVPMRIVASGGANYTITDDEVWGHQSYTWNLGGTTFGTLGAGNGVFNYKYVRCFGGEVRGELFIDGFRWSGEDAATITVHIDLYEGASCSTTDFDGQSEFYTFTIKPGQARSLYIGALNTDEDAWEGAWLMATIKALPM